MEVYCFFISLIFERKQPFKSYLALVKHISEEEQTSSHKVRNLLIIKIKISALLCNFGITTSL